MHFLSSRYYKIKYLAGMLPEHYDSIICVFLHVPRSLFYDAGKSFSQLVGDPDQSFIRWIQPFCEQVHESGAHEANRYTADYIQGEMNPTVHPSPGSQDGNNQQRDTAGGPTTGRDQVKRGCEHQGGVVAGKG